MRTSLHAALPLLILDAAAIGLAWSAGALLMEGRLHYPGARIGSPLLLLALAAFILIGNHARGLYAEARADRAVELVGCARSCLVAAIAVVVAGKAAGLEPVPWRTAGATAACLLLLIVARSGYRARMTVRRRANEAVRPAIVVGTNDEAFELCRLLDQDSAFGFRPWGVVGERSQYDRYPFDPPWLGDVDSIASALEHFGIDHVFVARTALSAAAFAGLTRVLTAKGVHVAASSGLPSLDQRRLKIMPIAQMPVYCLEATGPSKREAFVKRAVDVAVAVATLLAGLPVMALTALAILAFDGRPIFFRQQRVGRHGVPFTMFKFRTMVTDAEVRMIDLLGENERQGPLFKLTRDPRVTRIGRFLRDSSLDELPQLVNVLAGKMSLVGPRPALVSEAESFSKELLARNGSRPGMTGLWQVEAGDDPSFVLYQHLDLYYVENWSTALDLAILVATIPTVAWRTFERLMRARRKRLEGTVVALAPAPVVTKPVQPQLVQPQLVQPQPVQPQPVQPQPVQPQPVQPQPVELPRRPARGREFRHDVAVISSNGRAALPLGLAFAKGGLSVVLHDPDPGAVELMNRGKMPLRGGGERTLLRSALREGRLAASTDIAVISESECLVIVLGGDRMTGHAGSFIVEAVKTIKDGLRDGQLLVLENSLDPVVAQEVEDFIAGLGLSIDVALCRERLLGGPALPQFASAPQILCGRSTGALERAEWLFRARTALPQPAAARADRPAVAIDPPQLRGA
jgi:exopolysaccharide biosynthesis polyprenyl glycosylphosphotransferase